MNTQAADIMKRFSSGEITAAQCWNELASIRQTRVQQIELTLPPSKDYTPMTDAEQEMARNMDEHIRFGASKGARRFIGQIAKANQLTPRQREYFYGIIRRYRRQIWRVDPDHAAAQWIEARVTK